MAWGETYVVPAGSLAHVLGVGLGLAGAATEVDTWDEATAGELPVELPQAAVRASVAATIAEVRMPRRVAIIAPVGSVQLVGCFASLPFRRNERLVLY